MSASLVLKARFVVPVTGPVIENGAVAIDEGRIVGVSAAGGMSGSKVEDYGDSVILPGFVNAHTHLELHGMASRVPPGPDLVDWLIRVVGYLSAHPPVREDLQTAVRHGIEESLSTNVTTIGNITRKPA